MTSFQSFAEVCQRVEGISSTLEKVDVVASFLRDLDSPELSIASNFIMGVVFPPSSDIDLGVGPSILYAALERACGCSAGEVEEMLRETGDPGLVASMAVKKRKPQSLGAFFERGVLSISDVYVRFQSIARVSGKRSQESKVKNLQFLFAEASPIEAVYIARLAIEDMRIGVGEGGVRDAIAKAFGAPADQVERGYNITNDMGLVADHAKAGRLAELDVTLYRPLKMMLSQIGEGIPEALNEMGTAAIEWKFDGARVQIHKDGEKIRIYSRRLENVTASLPDVVEEVRKKVHAEAAILDGEAVAVGKDGRPMAFQEILKRFRRKYNVARLAAQIPLRLFLFDLIYLNGRSLIDLPLSERRALLLEVADGDAVAAQVLSSDPAPVEKIYREALAAGHEGIMIKNPASAYMPGKRGKNWLKIKPIMETLDLVVIGATWGEGRRATFLGSYRLACRDEATGDFLDVGYVATGLSDAALAELTEMFREQIIVQKGMEVELRPEVVFEVAYEEIQKSPNYSSGYALRFPRLVMVRDDKSPEEADALDRIESLYRMQRGRNNSS